MLSGSPIQNTINDLGCMLKMIASDLFEESDIITKYKLRADKPHIAQLRVDISPYIDRVLNSDIKINTTDLWDIVLWVNIDDEMSYMDKLYKMSEKIVKAKGSSNKNAG